MRCPSCGATNPDEAQWCGQCYTAFTEPEPDPQSSAGAEREAGAVTLPAPPGGDDAERRDAGADAGDRDASAQGQPRKGFRTTDEGLEWECATCGQFNSIDLLSCTVCGTSFAARYAPDEPEREPVNWNAALALSAVLPGTGHYLAGRLGAGIARGLLFVVWLTGGLLLLLTAGSAAALAAAPLLLGALVVWGGTLFDLVNLRHDGQELLSGRTLLWLVVGVTVLLLLGAFGGAARVT